MRCGDSDTCTYTATDYYEKFEWTLNCKCGSDGNAYCPIERYNFSKYVGLKKDIVNNTCHTEIRDSLTKCDQVYRHPDYDEFLEATIRYSNYGFTV